MTVWTRREATGELFAPDSTYTVSARAMVVLQATE